MGQWDGMGRSIITSSFGIEGGAPPPLSLRRVREDGPVPSRRPSLGIVSGLGKQLSSTLINFRNVAPKKFSKNSGYSRGYIRSALAASEDTSKYVAATILLRHTTGCGYILESPRGYTPIIISPGY